MPSPELLVIADDLTGANDAGVQFAAAGIRSIVLADHNVEKLPPSYAVVVINTESRHIPPAQAAQRAQRIAALGMRAGVKCFYKKTDSTLRGNIGRELEALLGATHAPFIPFVPALPDLGRTTRDGLHYVHGTLIAESPFSYDPLNPIRQSRVADILSSQTTVPLCTLKPGESPPESFRGIAIVDCESNDDLSAIARTSTGAHQIRVFSGSVALARHLIEHLEIDSAAPDRPDPQLPLLLINGSLNERALEQIDHGSAHFSMLQLRPEQLIGGHADLTIPPGGGNLLLYSIGHRSELAAFQAFAARQGLSEHQLHLRVAERMGRIVHEILSAGVFRTLVVFGGDTLAGIARARHWRSFEPLAELEPGISLSLPLESGLTLISKAGGFGDADVVSRIVDYVQNQNWQMRSNPGQK